MLLPEPMSRIVIVGNKSRLDQAIDALYELKLIHLIDHTVGTDDGFSIGASRPYTEKASERLLSLKAVEKELGIDPEKTEMDEPAAVRDVRVKISSNCVESITEEVFKVLDRKNSIVQKITEEKMKRDDLSQIAGIPVDLDLYRGYESVAVLAGSVGTDPTAALSSIADTELFVSGGGKKAEKRIMVLFVRKSEKDNALRILTDLDYTEISIPEGTGPVSAAIAESHSRIMSLTAELAEAEKEITGLKERHGDDILVLDEELSLSEEKGSLPLRIATSDFSFVIDAWVPTKKVTAVITGMDSKMGGNIYTEVQEDRSRNLHDVEQAEERFKETPTKMKHGPYVKNFEYPVKLLSAPKYQEIDPTILLSIFFPLFFGFMVGDIGYAIPFIILGAFGLKTAKSKDFKAIATILFFGGIWSFIFGFFMFGEMFGMHFVGHGYPTDPLAHTWESLLGVTFPEWFHIFPGIAHPGEGISKLLDVTFLLKISIYIGIMHIMLGFILGFMNIRMQHGTKAAFFEKGGWILMFIAMVMICWALTEKLIQGNDLFSGTVLIVFASGAAILAAGLAVTVKKEGALAIMELPSLVGNILSYARLTAIGMSKAGMALAFNYIGIIMLATEIGGTAGLIFGAVIFVVGHLMIWTLAILSAGLHSLRLQYVEMMSKFYVGGGKDYEPLEIKRKNTKIVETEV